jgi:hypothetical protein
MELDSRDGHPFFLIATILIFHLGNQPTHTNVLESEADAFENHCKIHPAAT